MRDFHLRFFIERRRPDGIEELIEIEDENILWVPESAGAYVLGTSNDNMFSYPWGSSPVYYIGQSRDLRKKLAEHRKYIILAKDDRGNQKWWPRYQYGVSFGATVAWYLVRGSQFPNRLEYNLMASFYEMYGSIPLANNIWPSGLRPIHGTYDG
jgi:hypothetical protein